MVLSDATRLRLGRENWSREVEDLLAERGIIVSYEAIRQWCRRFGSEYARRLNRKLRSGRRRRSWRPRSSRVIMEFKKAERLPKKYRRPKAVRIESTTDGFVSKR